MLRITVQLTSFVAMFAAGVFGATVWVYLEKTGIFATQITEYTWFVIFLNLPILLIGLLCLALWKFIALRISP